MTKTDPFDRFAAEYDAWFDAHLAVYESELEAIRSLLPAGGSGLKSGSAREGLLHRWASGLASNPRERWQSSLTGADLAWIAAIGVIHGFVALTLVITALAHLRTVEYSTIAYGEPVIAALIGGLAYEETLSALQILGCALVIGAGVARALVSEQPRNATALQSDAL